MLWFIYYPALSQEQNYECWDHFRTNVLSHNNYDWNETIEFTYQNVKEVKSLIELDMNFRAFIYK